MTVLPTDPGVVLIGCCLRDPGEIPWGRGVSTAAPRPHGTGCCAVCCGVGWINDVYFGATLGARCPACGGGGA